MGSSNPLLVKVTEVCLTHLGALDAIRAAFAAFLSHEAATQSRYAIDIVRFMPEAKQTMGAYQEPRQPLPLLFFCGACCCCGEP